MSDIEGFLTIYGHSDNLLNNNCHYSSLSPGDYPLTKKPEDSGTRLIKTQLRECMGVDISL